MFLIRRGGTRSPDAERPLPPAEIREVEEGGERSREGGDGVERRHLDEDLRIEG